MPCGSPGPSPTLFPNAARTAPSSPASSRRQIFSPCYPFLLNLLLLLLLPLPVLCCSGGNSFCWGGCAGVRLGVRAGLALCGREELRVIRDPLAWRLCLLLARRLPPLRPPLQDRGPTGHETLMVPCALLVHPIDDHL